MLDSLAALDPSDGSPTPASVWPDEGLTWVAEARKSAPGLDSLLRWAFELEASRTPPYPGYTYGDTLPNGIYLARGSTLTVPPHSYFAMGDNSPLSADGRVWGFVPAKDAVGRPLFIYYPFTRRWGPAR